MKYTTKDLEELRNDPFAQFVAALLGTTIDDAIKEAENEIEKELSRTQEVKKVKEEPKVETEDDEVGRKIKNFFDRLVNEGKATATVENGHPHYSIKTEDSYKDPEPAEELVEDNSVTSFSMTEKELEEFVRDYTDLENTFKKLEHTYGIDLDAGPKSIYSQYNEIVWKLIGYIFGDENREDIVDYCFGDSNFDTVEDLYEELV